jgi:hypothetical protein
MPEQEFLGVAKEGRRTGDSQRAAGSPVGPVLCSFGGLGIESQLAACRVHRPYYSCQGAGS